MAEPRTIVFATVDGFEVLVTLWPDGPVQVALRPEGQRSWGPPLEQRAEVASS